MRTRYFKTVLQYGAPIINTEEFHAALLQRHHLRSTVGLHSIRTAEAAYAIGRLFGEDAAPLIMASLCHDLGILGRERFRSGTECLKEHPIYSAEKAKKLMPNITETDIMAIKTHMWPLLSSIPKSREGWILSAADKIASVWDILGENPAHLTPLDDQTYFSCNE